MQLVAAAWVDDADVNVAERPDTPRDGSVGRRDQAQALVAHAGGRREPLEEGLAYFQTRLHQASDDFAATEGLRVVEAALRLVPRIDEP